MTKPSAIPDRTIRPLVVDGHVTTRIGLAVLLQREPWVGRCLLAQDAREGAALARRHRPEVAVLDVSQAGPFVASATAALRDAHPGIGIVLTSRCASQLSASLLELGATDFLPPGASGSEIVAAVWGAVMSRRAPERQARPEGPGILTERERELLALMSTGATNKEIAKRLHLGPDSVKKSASALYRKLGVRNRTEAVRHVALLLAAA
ncbi:MAG: response regulator transcription factor [Solirubrobacteraceae bacterium]